MSSICKVPKKNNDEQESHIVQDVLSMDTIAESWVIVSGASFQATAKKELMKNYVACNFGQIYLGDDEPCSIMAKGDVQIETQGVQVVYEGCKTCSAVEEEHSFNWLTCSRGLFYDIHLRLVESLLWYHGGCS